MDSRPIRVMRIIARLNVGGPAIHVVLLTEHLRPPEFESLLVCGKIGPHEGDMAYLARERGIEPVLVAELGRELSPLRDVMTLFKLWRLMRRFKPDVVHTHTAKAGFAGRVAAWLARVPVRVHTYHGHVLHGYFGPAKTRLFLWLERLTARLTDRLVTISPLLRDELADTYHVAGRDKFAVVPLGLELAAYADMPRRQGTFRAAHGLAAEAPLIGIVGRIVPIKNHTLFLEMAAQVRAQVPNARFAIVGDGELRADLEQSVQAMGLSDAVIFTGWVADLAPVYSDMDVLVISSDNEGTPTAIMQALAAGVRVVSTAVGGVPDLMRQGAWGRLTTPGDAAALADAVIQTLAETDSVDQVRREVVAAYDVQRLVDDLSALYRDLLAEKCAHAG